MGVNLQLIIDERSREEVDRENEEYERRRRIMQAPRNGQTISQPAGLVSLL